MAKLYHVVLRCTFFFAALTFAFVQADEVSKHLQVDNDHPCMMKTLDRSVETLCREQ